MQQPRQLWGQPWDPQCYQQYINRSDGYRNVENSGYRDWGSFSFFADGYVTSQLSVAFVLAFNLCLRDAGSVGRVRTNGVLD